MVQEHVFFIWDMVYSLSTHHTTAHPIKTQVMNRIMAMWRGGQIDGNMAMQLLGLQKSNASTSDTSSPAAGVPACDSGNEFKKKPISQVTPAEPEESLEEVLEQAKKAKNETSLCWLIFPLLKIIL